jgi:hypothetical protein
MYYEASDLDRFFGTMYATENVHDIWNLECEESVQVTEDVAATELAKYT